MADEKKRTTQEAPAETPVLTEYFFPTHGITISAASREEAEKQLEAKIKSKH